LVSPLFPFFLKSGNKLQSVELCNIDQNPPRKLKQMKLNHS